MMKRLEDVERQYFKYSVNDLGGFFVTKMYLHIPILVFFSDCSS